MKFTKELVDDLANKLLIGLTEKENKMVLEEFLAIDKSMQKVCEIEGIEKVPVMTHALDDMPSILAEDREEESIPIKEALRNAGAVEGREIEVPKVVI